jgi:hypothetical protein
MLYATYQRNSDTSNAIWELWDAVSIERMAMVGYWEEEPAVVLSWPHPPPSPLRTPPPPAAAAPAAAAPALIDTTASPPLPPTNGTCMSAWKETIGKFIAGGGGQAGDIGFGSSCGPAKPFDYPAMPLHQIQQQCCDLGDGCVAFSYAAAQDPTVPGKACARKSWGAGRYETSQTFNGYEKTGMPRPPAPPPPAPTPPPPPPGTCPPASILATTYIEYQVRAVVVVSSWCTTAKLVTLHLDWDAFGMKEGAVTVVQPAIAGVQAGKTLGNGSAPVLISGEDNGGVILVVTPQRSEHV